MSKIEDAIEEIIQNHLSGMDFSDMITTEVRECWDMDDLDRIDEMDDRLETVESWISPQNVIDLESSVKNLVEHTNQLQIRIRDLEDRLNDYEEIREMAWQSAKKTIFQKLMFWR